MRLKTIFILATFFIILSSKGQVSNTIKTIEAAEFSDKIKENKNAQILDVRTLDEYTSSHIENADLVNWNSDSFVLKTDKYDKTKPVFVYCLSGGRSKKASEKLAELGFTNIYELKGGIMKWNSAGFSKPNDKIIGIGSQEYAELLKSDKKIIVNFYAPWCAPCKKMEPYLLKMQEEMTDEIVFIRLNADKNKTIMQELKISELPTLLLYENKKITWQNSGYISEEDLKKQIK